MSVRHIVHGSCECELWHNFAIHSNCDLILLVICYLLCCDYIYIFLLIHYIIYYTLYYMLLKSNIYSAACMAFQNAMLPYLIL